MGVGNATSPAGAVNSSSNWTYSEEVAFPFGYGMAYTTFQYSDYSVTINEDGNYVVSLTVKNTGNANGADAVQIYVQKPYTEYDKQYGIEQASVNLAGYAKTPELKPGESVNIAVIVRDDALKTYDAYGQKTYIREAGDYYIVAAQDAHDAVNSILAAKGYTPENTDGRMDAMGNANLVEKISFADNDFETYSVSEITGYPITNQFDNADWNLYASRNEDETVTYLSRNDWNATYPTGAPKLSLTKQMVADLAYNHDIVEESGAKMPLYAQEHVFNLIDLRGLEYNHSAWDTLLNQLTFDEMISLLGTAYHGTKEIASIAKPAELTKDGPLGVRIKYLNSNEYTLSFPSTILLAATYNDQLALEVGELMGEDMMHAGITGIYGPGSNIHRNSYCARNWEYYSEDGFLSGMMGKWQVIGIQSKGCYVNMKHFALNDQETNRHGVCTFANEQSIREIYLASFEYAVTEGDCTGIMTAFNRIGTSWSGAHKGLCTEVLRNEWGFEGFVISDCSWQVYMGVIDGVLAGNDCILTNIDLANYESARTSPTAAQAVRESVHRILYVTVNSNSMNGISSNTKIIQVDEWWQVLVKDVQNTLMIIVGVLLLLTIITLIFGRNADDFGDKNILVTIISLILAVGMLVVSIGAPIVLNSLPNNFMSSSEDNPDEENPDDEIVDDRIFSKFEAECAELTASNSKTNKGTEGKGIAATNYPSGDAFIHNLENSDEFTVTFKIHSTADIEAALVLCMGRRSENLNVNDMFVITLNGEKVEVGADVGYTPYNTAKPKYFDWTELEVATVQLKEGENTLTLTRSNTADKIMNLDYIGFKADIELKDAREVQNGGHKNTAWTLLEEPTMTKEGKIATYCEYCRESIEEVVPAISEANGYTKTVVSENEGSIFAKVKWTYTKDSDKFEFTYTEYSSEAKEFIFEAEKAELGGSSKLEISALYGASGGANVGQMNNNNASITLDITADKAGEALLLICFGRRTDKDIRFNDGRTLTHNGKIIDVSNDVVFKQSLNGPNWYDWAEFEIVTLNLTEGKNTITLTNNAKNFGNVDYFKFVTASELTTYTEVEHEHIDSDNDGNCNTCGVSMKEKESVKIEAEGAEIVSNSYRTSAGDEGLGAAATNYPSGGAFIHNLENATEFSVTFRIYSPEAQKAVLVLCMGLREKELNVANMFDIWVNDNLLQISSDVGFGLFESVKYYDWTELEVATIDLVQGDNVITFTRNENEKNVLNFDYILIKSAVAVEDTREKNNGHSYDLHVTTAPTYSTTGEAGGYCKYCRDYKTVELPKVSVENGYTKLGDGVSSLWKYTFSDGTIINVSVAEDVEKSTYTFMVSADSNPFAGDNGSVVSEGIDVALALKNNEYYEKTQNAVFTTNVTVSERTVVTLIIKVKGADGLPAPCAQLFPYITVNGSSEGVSLNTNPSGTAGWSTTADAYVATIILEAGVNEIEFGRDGSNINILGIAFESTVPVTLGKN